MSRNKVNQTDGSLTMVAGRGKAEYGASTVRTGSFSNPALDAESGSTTQTITFAEPMPDSNYQVELDKGGNLSFVSVSSKTANGFTVTWARPYSSALPAGSTAVTYTAFKLYTDTEYNEVLETLTSPWVDISSDASTYIDTGYIKYKKIGQLVIVKMWNVIFKADSTGAGNTLSTNLPTCDDAATNRIFRDQKDGLGALYINTSSNTLLCHHKLPTGETTQTSWYGEMVYTTSD